jgi:hypothetical protein
MRKCIWTLNIDDYAPEICRLTYPLMKRFATKIGAEFRIINKRKFPDWPVVYEKMQIHQLGEAYDWNIYIDSDTLVHPDMFDPTNHIPKDTVMHNGADMAGLRWRYNKYLLRDGRNIGSCNWFTIGSDWCLDLWRPLECTLEQALENITPIAFEQAGTRTDVIVDVTTGEGKETQVPKQVITPEHLIDDYTCSQNIARFGLKFQTFTSLCQRLDPGGNCLWHQYTLTKEDKLKEMAIVLKNWGVPLLGLS